MTNFENMHFGRRERELAAFDKFTNVVVTGTSGVCINGRSTRYMPNSFNVASTQLKFLRFIGAC